MPIHQSHDGNNSSSNTNSSRTLSSSVDTVDDHADAFLQHLVASAANIRRRRENANVNVISSSSSSNHDHVAISSSVSYSSRSSLSSAAVIPPAVVNTGDKNKDVVQTKGMKNVRYEIKMMEGDGNCLFRAVSYLVYGDPEWHDKVRSECMDFISNNKDHYSQFIEDDNGEIFEEYVKRKKENGCYGNHIEIQAIAEIYSRPVQIFVDSISQSSSSLSSNSQITSTSMQNGMEAKRVEASGYILNELNIFHNSSYGNNEHPLRLLYRNGNHYDAIIDPFEASVGVGLGLPSFKPGLAEKNLIDEVAKVSELEHKENVNKLIEKVKTESEINEVERQLEQEVIKQSLADYQSRFPILSSLYDDNDVNRRDSYAESDNKKRKANEDENDNGDNNKEDIDRKRRRRTGRETGDYLRSSSSSSKSSKNIDNPSSVIEELVSNGYDIESVLLASEITGSNEFEVLLSFLISQNESKPSSLNSFSSC